MNKNLLTSGIRENSTLTMVNTQHVSCQNLVPLFNHQKPQTMSDNTWQFLSNQFETGTRNNFKRANVLNNDHLSKLTSEQADPDILALVTRTQPPSTAYSGAYSNWISARATYKGHTQLLDNLLNDLSSTKIKQWDIQIQAQFLEGTPEYTMILPNRRGPFQTGTKDERLSEVEALAQRLLGYAALAATQADVAAFGTALRTARDNQQQKEQLVSMASDVLENARLDLCIMMYGNLGVLMDKYRDTPAVIENFWQLDLIRRTGQGGNDDDLPTTTVRISGRVTSMAGGGAIANARIFLYDTANGPASGSIEVFTDGSGSYSVVIEDLPEAQTITMEVSAQFYMMQSRNLNIEPGQSYDGEDFQLSPMP